MKMGNVKQIEVTYGLKRPIAKYSSELLTVTLTKKVEAKTDDELKIEVPSTFLKARRYVETEKESSDTFGTC